LRKENDKGEETVEKARAPLCTAHAGEVRSGEKELDGQGWQTDIR
jgi:hypothetical protein